MVRCTLLFDHLKNNSFPTTEVAATRSLLPEGYEVRLACGFCVRPWRCRRLAVRGLIKGLVSYTISLNVRYI
jgi:hypothetical protein